MKKQKEMSRVKEKARAVAIFLDVAYLLNKKTRCFR